MTWERPENIPYPSIWSKFHGVRKINGSKPTFWIQDVIEDTIEDLTEKMLTGFIREEPVCKHFKFIEDPTSVAEAVEIYRGSLRNKLSCVCMTNDLDGNAIVVGVSCLGRTSKNDPKVQFQGESRAKMRSLYLYVYNLRDPFTHFGVDEYLSDRGIYVLPEYRGQGIGLEFLKCWSTICKTAGFKVVIGAFTSTISQSIADRAGFKELISISYEELAKVDPRYCLPGIEKHTKNLRILYVTV